MATLTTPLDLAPPDDARVRRTAGAGGLLAVLAWLLQPILVFGLVGDEERVTYAALERAGWSGPYEVLTFGLVGLGFLLLARGLRVLDERGGGALGAAASVGHLLGTVSAIGWLVVAAFASAPFTSASSDLADLEPAGQAAALSTYGVVQMGTLLLAALCGAGWLVLLGVSGLRRGLLGRPTAAALVVLGVVTAAPFAIPFSSPWGTLALLVAALLLGVQLLLRSRAGSTGALRPGRGRR